MKTLFSMTDFIENLRDEMTSKGELNFKETKEYFDKVFNYSDFLKQPLALGMFVPCDEKEKPLPEPQMRPERTSFDEKDIDYDAQELYEYIQAKEKVLFKGFYVEFNAVKSPQGGYLDIGNLKNKMIETIVGAELKLTESALKQIG